MNHPFPHIANPVGLYRKLLPVLAGKGWITAVGIPYIQNELGFIKQLDPHGNQSKVDLTLKGHWFMYLMRPRMEAKDFVGPNIWEVPKAID